MLNTMEYQEDCTVVEVQLHLDGVGQEIGLHPALCLFLEDAPEMTEAFDQVNYFGSWENPSVHQVNFIGMGHDFDVVKKGVQEFLNAFQSELNNKTSVEDWESTLENTTFPRLVSHEVLATREYRW